MSEKRIYTFGNGKAEGKADMKNLLLVLSILISASAFGQVGEKNFIDQNYSIEGLVLWKQDVRDLLNAIHSLDAKQQELITAVFYQKRTVSQIARESGVSQAAISQRLQTAIKNLRKLLKKTL